MTTYIRTCIYHDSSTKGFRHGIRSELTLTREEAQQVVAFVQRFIQIEEAALMGYLPAENARTVGAPANRAPAK